MQNPLWAVTRITLHIKSRDLKIDDKDPFELKPAELRKACAQVKFSQVSAMVDFNGEICADYSEFLPVPLPSCASHVRRSKFSKVSSMMISLWETKETNFNRTTSTELTFEKFCLRAYICFAQGTCTG